MSTWNHRLIDMTAENNGEPWLAICEVFYGDDGKPQGYTGPVNVSGENIEEIRQTLERMRKAVENPTLKPEDFE